MLQPTVVAQDHRTSFKVGNYRWTICSLIFFATTINYLDRQVNGVSESAGINRLETENERVLQRKLSQSLWPRTLRWEQ